MFAGIVLLCSKAFTMLMIDGSTMSLCCLRRCVGNASSSHDLVADFLMILKTSSSLKV